MGDMFSIAERWHHMQETEERAVAGLPEHLKPFWGKRVFHPEAGGVAPQGAAAAWPARATAVSDDRGPGRSADEDR